MATKNAPGLESIDRLEEKIKLLVNTIVRLKGEQTRVTEDNGGCKREIEGAEGPDDRSPRAPAPKSRPSARNAT